MQYTPKTALVLAALAALGLTAARPAAAAFTFRPAVQPAAGLDGTSITGSLTFGGGSTNYYDPAHGYVPAGFSNTVGPTVTVTEPEVEFGFNDTANLDTADFRNGQLILTDTSQFGGSNAEYKFTDAAFGSVTKLFDDFGNGGLSYSLVGDTLTINSAAFSGGGTQEAIFNIGGAPVPEASTTVSFGLLLVLGLGIVLVAAKRGKAAAS